MASAKCSEKSPPGPLLSEKGFNDISSNLGTEWVHVAFGLGIKKSDIDQLQLDSPNQTRKQIIGALLEWRNRSKLGGIDLIKELFESLNAEDRMDLVVNLKTKYRTEELEFCQDHTKEEVTSYCSKCESFSCQLCSKSSHKKHPLKSIEDAATKSKKLLKKLLDPSNESLSQDIEKEKKSLYEMKKTLHNDFQRSIESLETHRKEMINAIDKFTKRQSEKMSELTRESDSYINHYESILSQITETVQQTQMAFNEMETNKSNLSTKIVKLAHILKCSICAMEEGKSKLDRVKSPTFIRNEPKVENVERLMEWEQISYTKTLKHRKREPIFESYSLGRIHKRRSSLVRTVSNNASGDTEENKEYESLEQNSSSKYYKILSKFDSSVNSACSFVSPENESGTNPYVDFNTNQVDESLSLNSQISASSTKDGSISIRSRAICKSRIPVSIHRKSNMPSSSSCHSHHTC